MKNISTWGLVIKSVSILEMLKETLSEATVLKDLSRRIKS